MRKPRFFLGASSFAFWQICFVQMVNLSHSSKLQSCGAPTLLILHNYIRCLLNIHIIYHILYICNHTVCIYIYIYKYIKFSRYDLFVHIISLFTSYLTVQTLQEVEHSFSWMSMLRRCRRCRQFHRQTHSVSSGSGFVVAMVQCRISILKYPELCTTHPSDAYELCTNKDSASAANSIWWTTGIDGVAAAPNPVQVRCRWMEFHETPQRGYKSCGKFLVLLFFFPDFFGAQKVLWAECIRMYESFQ